MILQLTMKAPVCLILSLTLSLFLTGYGTAKLFRKKVDVDFEDGTKKVITKFKDTEKRVGEWQEKSRPVKEFMLHDLQRILNENKEDVQEITSIKSITRPHVYLAKRNSYSSPGPSYGPYGPGRKNCGPPPPQPYYGPGKGYVTGKGYSSGYQSGNQKKCNDNSCDDFNCTKNKNDVDKKKKFKESCNCSDSDDSGCSSKCNKKNHDHNKENNKKNRGRKDDGWDDNDNGNFAQYW
ncbi:uncharacterized protein LOC142326038 [Lycorma delicatula]|uniref:uncharacterized protein LOC142326038 n=1 Tax=Lycorma delicatula TaxID=130591 RepID=UPI003F51005D